MARRLPGLRPEEGSPAGAPEARSLAGALESLAEVENLAAHPAVLVDGRSRPEVLVRAVAPERPIPPASGHGEPVELLGRMAVDAPTGVPMADQIVAAVVDVLQTIAARLVGDVLPEEQRTPQGDLQGDSTFGVAALGVAAFGVIGADGAGDEFLDFALGVLVLFFFGRGGSVAIFGREGPVGIFGTAGLAVFFCVAPLGVEGAELVLVFGAAGTITPKTFSTSFSLKSGMLRSTTFKLSHQVSTDIIVRCVALIAGSITSYCRYRIRNSSNVADPSIIGTQCSSLNADMPPAPDVNIIATEEKIHNFLEISGAAS